MAEKWGRSVNDDPTRRLIKGYWFTAVQVLIIKPAAALFYAFPAVCCIQTVACNELQGICLNPREGDAANTGSRGCWERWYRQSGVRRTEDTPEIVLLWDLYLLHIVHYFYNWMKNKYLSSVQYRGCFAVYQYSQFISVFPFLGGSHTGIGVPAKSHLAEYRLFLCSEQCQNVIYLRT